ncbi:CO dehydrogenase/acetyl-CoA synthase complex subunit epsilon [Methanosarcinales archaeon]|nr:MAG: CO dehydrogenase/acetyl-CoA synthase complex subunit epsilon [Methanosarcinales archaeon]
MSEEVTKMNIPFDIGNISGPEMGRVATPEAIGRAIKTAKRPLLVVGSEILEDGLIDTAIAIGKKGVPIAATAHSMQGFVGAGYTDNVHLVGLHELANNIKSPDWMGFDGEGGYDLVAVLGGIYYSTSQFLIAIKNCAIDPIVRGVSIDRYYHIAARMTFDNISRKRTDEFKEMLGRVVQSI